jgi:geranylgeranyl diphosphate synthase, type II
LKENGIFTQMQSVINLQTQFENYLLSQAWPTEPDNLYAPCKHILQIGGKRIRPVALLMAYELFTEIDEPAFNAATAVELFHNFTLIHDDIMDNSPIRRGQPTVHNKWNNNIAILSGDVMNIYAYEYINKLPKDHLQDVLKVFNTTAIEVCEGQQMDMDFEQRSDVRLEEYIQMITLKTSVLLAAAFKIGAILGGATMGTAQMLYDFGKNVGISFQLKDDYLDAFGDSQKTGKQVGGDILANKKTCLYLHAYEKANVDQKALMDKLIAENPNDKVAQMLDLFYQLEVPQWAQAEKAKYSNIAFEILEQLPILSSRKAQLKALAEYLLIREA